MKKNNKAVQVNKRLLFETVIVVVVTIVLFLVFNNLKSIVTVIPVIYLLIERRIRHRSWSDIGFKVKSTLTDVEGNWYWILLVGVISPLVTFYIGKYCIPGFIDHVKSRLPMDINIIIPALITSTIGTFLEEIIFRGFIQGRLEWYLRPFKAIALASILFAFMHYSQGSFIIVAFDISGILIDGIILGIIFTRTKNIFSSWIGHYLSDLVGIVCMLFLL